MEWKQVKVYTSTIALDIVSGVVISNGIRGVMVEDAQAFEEFLEDPDFQWDYLDDHVMQLKDVETAVIFYIPDTVQGMEMLSAVQREIRQLPEKNPGIDFGRLVFESEDIDEQEWSTAWKKYYHPVRVGGHIVICPEWEKDCPLGQGDIKIILDPGMAFGTGTHETTRLCMEFLEESVTAESTVLDIGTGSGILAATALLLGAKSAVGVDIDELSVKIARENAVRNGVAENLTLYHGDLTEQVHGAFDVICANIVADVLIRLSEEVTQFMHGDSVLILSGIIEDRYDDVAQAMNKAGLLITGKKQENDWVSLRLQLKEDGV